jgi:hypothetical protein
MEERERERKRRGNTFHRRENRRNEFLLSV